ncbi:protein of unknown function DUF1501 [Chthoniobacter flavus Ellin428]|uniref:DUF1501 domain-containing protein n=2 Tax=Chthoniobacter flavus TaxID=191863 RepID=B4D9Q2_9BACT|nr:protein of unknown function DUF1501 [Chthoniobacter flavus Ellin428]
MTKWVAGFFSEAMSPQTPHRHSSQHAFTFLNPRVAEGITVHSRRSMLKASLAGMAGLTLPGLLQLRAEGTKDRKPVSGNKAVILLWMTGGPSHIDTWDPKPEMPREIRGPFQDIPTKVPGVHICEYLPKQAALLDRFTLIRSVDCRESNHEPNMVMQTANRAAEPRTNPRGHLYPAIGSLVARFRGANHPGMPPYIALNMKSRSHLAWGGYLGQQFDPFDGANASRLFQLPSGLTMDRLQSRKSLSEQMDTLRRNLDASGGMEAMDRFSQQAFDIVAGGRAQEAFDLKKEPARIIERYGEHDWCRQALLARRLVERGASFVTIDLSNHSGSGTWDNHGDNIPPYGGIWNGLRPLLPVFDHLITTLVTDLADRGLLDDTLVVAMGEFGRSPTLGTQGSTDGRNHWPYVMSMCLAGGGFRHGQVIGASSRDGGEIAHRPVTPGDLAATIYQHMGVPLNATYTDHQGRPIYIVEKGQPIRELS